VAALLALADRRCALWPANHVAAFAGIRLASCSKPATQGVQVGNGSRASDRQTLPVVWGSFRLAMHCSVRLNQNLQS